MTRDKLVEYALKHLRIANAYSLQTEAHVDRATALAALAELSDEEILHLSFPDPDVEDEN